MSDVAGVRSPQGDAAGNLETHRLAAANCIAENILDFWLTVVCFNRSATSILESGTASQVSQGAYEQLRSDALQIFFQYLSDSADAQVPVELEVCARLYESITHAEITADVFSEVETIVRKVMLREHYPLFLDSDPYHRCMHTLRYEIDHNGADLQLELVDRGEFRGRGK